MLKVCRNILIVYCVICQLIVGYMLYTVLLFGLSALDSLVGPSATVIFSGSTIVRW
jgi:hypothetical protein